MVDHIQHHIHIEIVAFTLEGRHQDGGICPTHVIVQQLPLATPLHGGPCLGLPDVVLGSRRREERRKQGERGRTEENGKIGGDGG